MQRVSCLEGFLLRSDLLIWSEASPLFVCRMMHRSLDMNCRIHQPSQRQHMHRGNTRTWTAFRNSSSARLVLLRLLQNGFNGKVTLLSSLVLEKKPTTLNPYPKVDTAPQDFPYIYIYMNIYIWKVWLLALAGLAAHWWRVYGFVK